MFTVYWISQTKRLRKQHGSYDTFEQAMQSIKDWWKENDYQPRYYRVIEHGRSFMIDYGLYDCFYEIVYEPTEKE